MAKSKAKSSNLKEIFDELESISQWFQKEDMDLSVGLEKFKRGTKLVEQAEKLLKETENTFKKIKVTPKAQTSD